MAATTETGTIVPTPPRKTEGKIDEVNLDRNTDMLAGISPGGDKTDSQESTTRMTKDTDDDGTAGTVSIWHNINFCS